MTKVVWRKRVTSFNYRVLDEWVVHVDSNIRVRLCHLSFVLLSQYSICLSQLQPNKGK